MLWYQGNEYLLASLTKIAMRFVKNLELLKHETSFAFETPQQIRNDVISVLEYLGDSSDELRCT